MFVLKAIGLNSKYPIGEWLKSSSIEPGNYYSVSEISDAIKNKTGKVPLVHCTPDKSWGGWIQWQSVDMIAVCLDMKTANLDEIDCPFEIGQFCLEEENVYYPAKGPLSWESLSELAKRSFCHT